MKAPEEIQLELKQLQEKLKKKEKAYRRIKWVFKPFIVLGIVLLFLSTVLPFIAPIAIPVVIAGAAAFLVRYLLYKYIFGDPKSRFQDGFEKEIQSMLSSFGSFEKNAEANIRKEEFDQIKVGIKSADGTINGPRFSGTWLDQKVSLGYVAAINESWSLGGMVQDVAEGIMDDITGMGFDHSDAYVSYSSDRKKIYKGLVAKIEVSHDIGQWLLTPKPIGKLLRENSRFVINWKNADVKEQPYILFTKTTDISTEAVALSSVLSKAQTTAISISATGNNLYICFPWKENYFEPELKSDFSTSVAFFNSLQSQFDFINSCIEALRKQ